MIKRFGFCLVTILCLTQSAFSNQALFDAVASNNEKEVDNLLSKKDSSVDVNFSIFGTVEHRPLAVAISNRNLTLVKKLVEHGADLNFKFNFSDDPDSINPHFHTHRLLTMEELAQVFELPDIAQYITEQKKLKKEVDQAQKEAPQIVKAIDNSLFDGYESTCKTPEKGVPETTIEVMMGYLTGQKFSFRSENGQRTNPCNRELNATSRIKEDRVPSPISPGFTSSNSSLLGI